MEIVKFFFDFIIHLDRHLNLIVQNYGTWTYLIIFLILFCETGLVITPFLPGDSLLFALGMLAASKGAVLKIDTLFLTLITATILGDTTNYWIGHFTGAKIFEKEKIRFIKKEHLERTHQFYEKHGGKTITIARFFPIIRTFSPFVAGISRINYGRFLIYSILGGIFWVALFLSAGFFFGGLPFIKDNFTMVVMGIILVSLIPIAFEVLRKYLKNSKPQKTK